MNYAKTERAALCQELDRVGPDAPTLCEGWTTYDLAAHLWLRETDPLSVPGILIKPLAGLTERRMAECKERFAFADLVAKLRQGPIPYSVFALPGFDDAGNTIEYFVHHEDVRRAQPTAVTGRALDPAFEDWVWRRLRLLARPLFRRATVGIVLERADCPDARVHAMPGSRLVTLVGLPSELLLYGYGRSRHAHVQAVGTPEAVAAVAETDLSL